ncbi:hypothetical protein AwErysi_01040 [Erysipelotrichaceae bacterium]|nr:hypothetical protein AwErysi_01040 [Erysipelotrichaceae bacterium]
MTTVMLVIVPKNSGAGYAGRPLKNLTKGVLEVKNGEDLPIDPTIFTTATVGMEVIVDGISYIIRKVSAIMPSMGKIVLEPQD